MEGKELYNEEDEQNKKPSGEDDADSFGLPEIDSRDKDTTDLGEPFSDSWKKPGEENEPIFSSSSTSEQSESDSSYQYSGSSYESDYSSDNDEIEDENQERVYKSSYYEDSGEQRKSPVVWIVLAIVFLIAIIVGVLWWINRTPPPPPVVQQPVEQRVVQPTPEPEPVRVVEPVKQAGVFEIDQPTGRYHVIVASSIDKDLVRDYAEKLAKNGMTCNILAPRGNKKFHRLSVADYVSLNEAALRSEQLKGEFGSDVWVIRY